MSLKAGDLNLYRYVDNSPVKKNDPTGKLSPASVTFCVVSIAAGALYDSVSSVKEGSDLADAYQKKIDALKAEKKTCSSNRKIEIDIEMDKLTRNFQKENLQNMSSVSTPGAGTIVGAAACAVAAIFF